MSNRASEYRGLIDDVVSGGLLDEDEWVAIGDLIARIERRLAAQRSDQPAQEPAE